MVANFVSTSISRHKPVDTAPSYAAQLQVGLPDVSRSAVFLFDWRSCHRVHRSPSIISCSHKPAAYDAPVHLMTACAIADMAGNLSEAKVSRFPE